MQKKLNTLCASAAIALALLGAPPVFCATVIPVGGSTSSPIGDGAIANVIDGVVDYSSFLQLGPVAMGAFTGPFTVRFELGGQYDLAGMNLWNNAGSIGNDGEGMSTFSLTFRDTTLSTVANFAGTATDTLAQQTFAFAVSGVSFVDLTITSNHPEHGGARQYVDFHEINFSGAASAPDSTSTAYLIVAAAISGCWLRRRNAGGAA